MILDRRTLATFADAAFIGGMLALATAAPGAEAYHTNFQGSCTNDYYATSGVNRAQARIYAEIGANEGYQWAGGCWNDNNRDDASGDPTGDPNTRGEGGDCSGFTYKSWYERYDTTDPGSTTTTACGSSMGRSRRRRSRTAPASRTWSCPKRSRSKWTPWPPQITWA